MGRCVQESCDRAGCSRLHECNSPDIGGLHSMQGISTEGQNSQQASSKATCEYWEDTYTQIREYIPRAMQVSIEELVRKMPAISVPSTDPEEIRKSAIAQLYDIMVEARGLIIDATDAIKGYQNANS